MPTATPLPIAPTPAPTALSAALEQVVFDVDPQGYLVDHASRRAIWLTDGAGLCYRMRVAK